MSITCIDERQLLIIFLRPHRVLTQSSVELGRSNRARRIEFADATQARCCQVEREVDSTLSVSGETPRDEMWEHREARFIDEVSIVNKI